jgi:hypothetical protein
MSPKEQNIKQNIGTSTGSIQNTIAGRDASTIQRVTTLTGNEVVTQKDFVKLLNDVEEILSSSTLAPKELTEILEDIGSAKKEASKDKPHIKKIIGNLSSALSAVNGLSGTTEVAKQLVEKLGGPVSEMARWLGVAVSDLWN